MKNQKSNAITNKNKVKTNADRIRAMKDQELAEFLINFKNTFGEEYEGEMSCLAWLKSNNNEAAYQSKYIRFSLKEKLSSYLSYRKDSDL